MRLRKHGVLSMAGGGGIVMGHVRTGSERRYLSGRDGAKGETPWSKKYSNLHFSYC